MTSYNGHRSWNAWNVSLWISNDETIYKTANEFVRKHGKEKAARHLFRILGGSKTPDGATYNHRSIRDALRGWA
jgi:hypothetical protein